MFTRLAVTALTGMSGRLLRRTGSSTRRSEKQAAARPKAAAPSAAATAEAQPPAPGPAAAQEAPETGPAPAASALTPPVDHFRFLKPRPEPPLPARLAGRSLPILAFIGVLITALLAAGAMLGELPLIGTVDSPNPAWAAALVTISLWAAFLLWKVPQWQAAAWERSGNSNPRELFQIENESRATLGQILSGVAVLTGLIFAWQQLGQTSDNLRVSQEGQITDRFTRAVDQLGSDDLTVRLGGIYALERIARDSPRDYGPVMEVLTAYVRQTSPAAAQAAATPAARAPRAPLDVLAVLKVIGRRSPEQVAVEMEEGSCLDLSRVNAIGADLASMNLRNTCWDGSDLRGAILAGANLSDATFNDGVLDQANLDGTDAAGSSFARARLSFANLSRADFQNANLLAADLTGATLQGTDLTNAVLLRTDLKNALLLGADLSGADVLDANFAGATLSGALLASAQNVTAAQIDPALVDGATTLPAGIDIAPDF